METRAFFIALILLLFWLAPQPKSTQANDSSQPPSVRMTANAARINIKPYTKPLQPKLKARLRRA